MDDSYECDPPPFWFNLKARVRSWFRQLVCGHPPNMVSITSQTIHFGSRYQHTYEERITACLKCGTILSTH